MKMSQNGVVLISYEEYKRLINAEMEVKRLEMKKPAQEKALQGPANCTRSKTEAADLTRDDQAAAQARCSKK